MDSSTPDLLWALKGAGQFFGVVTEIEMQCFPLEIIGSSDGTVWKGTLGFPIDQAKEVASACGEMVHDEENNATVTFLITQHPVTHDPCVLVLLGYFGSTADADKFFEPLMRLGPMMVDAKRVEYIRLNDGLDIFCGKGGYKHFTLNGVPEFNAEPWTEIATIFGELTKECEDMLLGGYGFEFATGKQKLFDLDSAWGHRGVKVWM